MVRTDSGVYRERLWLSASLHTLQVLLDIGAGNGYFSLAAAARGHRAIAFELSNQSLASFEASIAYNGFQDKITIHKVLYSLPCMNFAG